MPDEDWRDELVAKMDREFLELLDAQARDATTGPAVTIYMPCISVFKPAWEPLYQRRTKTPKETTCQPLK